MKSIREQLYTSTYIYIYINWKNWKEFSISSYFFSGKYDEREEEKNGISLLDKRSKLSDTTP